MKRSWVNFSCKVLGIFFGKEISLDDYCELNLSNASYSLPRPSIRIFPSLCKYCFKISERLKKYRREQELKKTTLCFDHFTAVSVRSELLTLSSDPSISLRSLCENHPGRFLLLIPLLQPQLHNCDHSLLISPPYIATIRWNVVISVEE